MAARMYYRKRFRSFVIKGILIAVFFSVAVIMNQFEATNEKDNRRLNTDDSFESYRGLRRKLLSSSGFTPVYVYNDKYSGHDDQQSNVKLGGKHVNSIDDVTEAYDNNNTEEFICTQPAYHEFPPDGFTTKNRLQGPIVIHVLVVIYMFVALAIVCDVYFVASLEKISVKLNLSEDVAGATFMAAGSSAPELFTSIIGVFIAKGDVGVGTIVGSAVFNILFVIGICGILVKQAVQLTWWPLARDSFFYSFSVVVLIASIADSHIKWYESFVMIILYVLYIVTMKFNTSLQTWAVTKAKSFSEGNDVRSAILQTGVQVKYYTDYAKFQNESTKQNGHPVELQDSSVIAIDEYIAHCPTKLSFEDACFRFMKGPRFHPITRFKAAAYIIICERQKYLKDPVWRSNCMRHTAGHCDPVCPDNDEGEAVDSADSWKRFPSMEADGLLYIVKWIVLLPLNVIMYYSIPDCRQQRWDKWFMVTFIMSIVWIAGFSYIMVWMVAIIGFTLGIPDSIMGITFLAAGTSVPDAMASVMVARQGQGDMAVSNTMGSNVFDICIGLALPWFIQTAMVKSGSTVHINSNGMVFSVILLFLTVIIAVVTIHSLRWRLNKRVGVVCLSSYAVFVLFSILIEFNVFGYVNPPMCSE